MTGLTFEHNAIIQLISERCNRLLVVLSPNFSKSPVNKFFLNYAQAVSIGMCINFIIVFLCGMS